MSSSRAQSDPPEGLSRLLSPVLRWMLLLGVLVHLVGILLFRVDSTPLPRIEKKSPFIVFLPDEAMSEGALLEARASLFDSAPLFVPTQWSTVAGVSLDLDRQGNLPFEDYLPSISLIDELQPRRSFGLEEYAVEGPEDLLALRFFEPFESFGQDMHEVRAVSDWFPQAHFRVVGAGETGASTDMKTLRADRLSELPRSDRPFQCYIHVSQSGRLLSRPVVIESSGRAQTDSEVIDWLLDPETIARLPVGYLEVSIYL